MNVNCTWSNHELPSQCKIIVAYCTSNHRFAIEIEQWMNNSITRDTRQCHFCSYNAIENEAHFVLECPLYKPIKDKFPLLFKNVVMGSLQAFIQIDQ